MGLDRAWIRRRELPVAILAYAAGTLFITIGVILGVGLAAYSIYFIIKLYK